MKSTFQHTKRSIAFSEIGGSNRALIQNHGIIIHLLYRAKMSILHDGDGILIIRTNGKQ